MNARPACLLALLLAGATAAGAMPGAAAASPVAWRGTWFWAVAASQHPWGSAAVVGDPQREAAVIRVLRRWNINRVYGSYLAVDLAADPQRFAAWNDALHRHAIGSLLVLSTAGWILPERRAELRQVLQARLIDFNAARASPDEGFSGLHFDIEPHTLPEWSSLSALGKRDYLNLLRDLYADARDLLDQHGLGALPIYAALPVWYDRLPAALGGNGPIGWDSVAERDAWFTAIGASLAGISLMAYETADLASIRANVAWEQANFPGEVRIALRAAGHEWATVDDMLAIAGQLEADTGEGIDIHPFYTFAELLADRPGTTFAEWCAAHFNPGELADPAISGPAASPAADGIANLWKYAVGLSPRANLSLPLLRLEPAAAGATTCIQFRRLIAADDLVWTLETSADLRNWSASMPELLLSSSDGLIEVLTVRAVPPAPESTAWPFVRLRLGLVE